jgi:hypothetical protein
VKHDSVQKPRRNSARELSKKRAFWSKLGEQKNSVDLLLALLVGRVSTRKRANP